MAKETQEGSNAYDCQAKEIIDLGRQPPAPTPPAAEGEGGMLAPQGVQRGDNK